jgi:hypothetical protein
VSTTEVAFGEHFQPRSSGTSPTVEGVRENEPLAELDTDKGKVDVPAALQLR